IDLSFVTGGIGVPYFIDIDNDNDLDLFCSTTTPSPGVRLWINDGAGNLAANTTNLIVTDALTTTALNRGASWFDIDNDGDVDLVSLNQNTGTNSRVYFNDGAGNFTSKTTAEVFGEGIASRLSTHGDFDADGDQDFLAVSTIGATVPLQPGIYNNNGNGTFTRVPQTTQTFQTISGFEGASLADYSNDGFLDIFVGNFNGGDALDLRGEFLYKNKGNTNNWLKLKLVGKASTRTPLGAKIKAFANGNQQLRTMTSFAGSFSPNSTVVHFGLGANTKADSIQIFWPSGAKQTVKNVNAKQFLTINEELPLDRDSVVLRQLYAATGGMGWTNKANWLTGPVKTWYGVTITNNRVSALNLPSNNLMGQVPAVFSDLLNIRTVNLSGNKITKLPDLKPLTNITSFDVSKNQLDFASLIPNVTLLGINYANQADIGTATTQLVDVGANYTVKVSTKGVGNTIQWKRNGVVVT
ncbi:MAG: FG-GAP-like repeat-containing protein, partial [Cytophagales bacterium]